MKILHIEDNVNYQNGLRYTLGDVISYTGATSVEAALDLIEKESFDAIVCDDKLEGKLTGVDFIKFVRSKGIGILIIGCSSGSNDALLSAGADYAAFKQCLFLDNAKREDWMDMLNRKKSLHFILKPS